MVCALTENSAARAATGSPALLRRMISRRSSVVSFYGFRLRRAVL